MTLGGLSFQAVINSIWCHYSVFANLLPSIYVMAYFSQLNRVGCLNFGKSFGTPLQQLARLHAGHAFCHLVPVVWNSFPRTALTQPLTDNAGECFHGQTFKKYHDH